jgi:hypothetical protein
MLSGSWSNTVARMPLANKSRPTISTSSSRGSIRSSSRVVAPSQRSSAARSAAASTSNAGWRS